jgi:hypothetical protein
MSEVIREDEPKHGNAALGAFFAHVQPDAEMQIALPRTYEREGFDPIRVPYVVDVGRVQMHMERAEVERLHALLGRALEVTE